MSSVQIKKWASEMLPPQWRHWLWARKVALGNRRIREVGDHLAKQLKEAAQQDLHCIKRISNNTEWEFFRNERIAKLRRLLAGQLTRSEPPAAVITGTLERDGHRIDNVVFQGHMDLPVTANFYRPIQPVQKTPGMVVCHSHHDPKTEEELQCMGMTLAQQGCRVLIMDLLGHGERRQHPFAAPADYRGAFRVDRQDYYFRSVLGMQLDLIGESLMGWMVQDIRRGIDLLWADSRIDRDRIILIGAVAGGGDVAAVAGALDDRIAAVVAFNFGHLSMGDWDPTRSLPDTARCGLWPWVILASLAPRRLVYGREFAWNAQQDLVWQALGKVYGLYNKRDSLRSVHGSGHGARHGLMDSHCTNIGPIHRKQLYPILQEWFGIPVPEQEVTEPVPTEKLECLTTETGRMFGARLVHEVAQDICHHHLTPLRRERGSQEPSIRTAKLQQALLEVLGPMGPFTSYQVQSHRKGLGGSEQATLEVEENVFVRLQLLWPSSLKNPKPPVVIGLTQEGHLRLRKARRPLIQSLLRQGIVVCLTDVRGIGDGRHGELYRGRLSPSAGIAATSLMVGESLLISRVRDLRTVMAYLRHRKDIDQERIGLWGDSLAETNSLDTHMAVPLDAAPSPSRGEPLGGVAALLTALYEPQVQAVSIHGSLVSYAALLQEPFVYQPADSIIRGLLRTADLPDLAASLAPRPLRMEELVDGCNRHVSRQQAEETYSLARTAYAQANQPDRFSIEAENPSVENISEWFQKSFYGG